ncbi:hypothetical protein VNO77_15081 [Canavalia gladiata]|uniref:Uncharacterized protein n=1 Tax=Canavalia gladiata TaxID=3824 RepID=A0AAN9LYN1_CANGL
MHVVGGARAFFGRLFRGFFRGCFLLLLLLSPFFSCSFLSSFFPGRDQCHFKNRLVIACAVVKGEEAGSVRDSSQCIASNQDERMVCEGAIITCLFTAEWEDISCFIMWKDSLKELKQMYKQFRCTRQFLT